jgi:hypothetical protein
MSRNRLLVWAAGLSSAVFLPGCLNPFLRDQVTFVPRGGEVRHDLPDAEGPPPAAVTQVQHREASAGLAEPPRLKPGPSGPKPPPLVVPAEARSAEPATDVAWDKPAAAPAPGTDRAAVAALRAYLEGRADDALRELHGCKGDPDVLLVLYPCLARLAEEPLDRVSPGEASELIDQLHGLERVLSARAALRIEKMSFCRNIQDFGRIQPQEEQHGFEAGRDGKPGELVQVYIELSNVSSKANGPWHDTWLAGQAEIYDSNHQRAWLKVVPPELERSSSPKHDHFINFYFYVPPCLPPGDYQLWVKVEDVTGMTLRDAPPGSPEGRPPVPGHRTAVGRLDFRVTAPKALRGAGAGGPRAE